MQFPRRPWFEMAPTSLHSPSGRKERTPARSFATPRPHLRKATLAGPSGGREMPGDGSRSPPSAQAVQSSSWTTPEPSARSIGTRTRDRSSTSQATASAPRRSDCARHRPMEFAGRRVPSARVRRPSTVRLRSEGSPGVGRSRPWGPRRHLRREQFRVRRSVYATRRTFSVLAPIRPCAGGQVRRAMCGSS
jgi:hypothetical protein